LAAQAGKRQLKAPGGRFRPENDKSISKREPGNRFCRCPTLPLTNKKDKPVYFFRPPDFCLAPDENKQWAVSGWAQDQDAVFYQKMTMCWTELLV
jgi:hypothetical protein